MKKSSKINQQIEDLEQQNGELLADLQRTRADFENFRKNVEADKNRLRQSATQDTILKLLPMVDEIERATAYLPKELAKNKWAEGVVQLNKKLQSALAELKVSKIDCKAGQVFDHDLHVALMMDEADGDEEVVAEVLQNGYLLNGQVLRPVAVKVTRR